MLVHTEGILKEYISFGSCCTNSILTGRGGHAVYIEYILLQKRLVLKRVREEGCAGGLGSERYTWPKSMCCL